MNMGERNLVPVLTYLFRRIEKRLTGAPSLIILDEAWLMLGHPLFRDKIREWLKVLRKANCAVVLATQSISRSEEHTSELQSLIRISYAVFCLNTTMHIQTPTSHP